MNLYVRYFSGIKLVFVFKKIEKQKFLFFKKMYLCFKLYGQVSLKKS